MSLYEIYITYVSWGNGGKDRPVLVFELDNGVASVYSVTSQYTGTGIHEKYYKINDWAEAGLHKQSYVDTSSYFDIPLRFLSNKTSIGRLSFDDKKALLKFLSHEVE